MLPGREAGSIAETERESNLSVRNMPEIDLQSAVGTFASDPPKKRSLWSRIWNRPEWAIPNSLAELLVLQAARVITLPTTGQLETADACLPRHSCSWRR